MDDAQAETAVVEALRLGYRLIDTAARYGNETGVGRALAATDVPREEVVVTTKLRGSQQGYEVALAGFEESRLRLGLDYVDLYLIHWPLPMLDRYVDSWRALVHLRDEGLVRAIGVSNFEPAHISRVVDRTGVWPAVNQIEVHPDFAQTPLRTWNAEHDIATESWSPLGAQSDLLADPTIVRLAREHERTPGQLVLRWHTQSGAIPIPKSSNPRRMAENLQVFDFALSDDDLKALATLDVGRRLGGEPASYVEM